MSNSVSAGQIMDRVANLLNDPKKTDYNYATQLPYLNMAIEELSDLMAEANSSLSNVISTQQGYRIVMPAGIGSIAPYDVQPGEVPANWPRYPVDLIEIQEIGERPSTLPVTVNPLVPPINPNSVYPFPNPFGNYWDDQRPFIRLPRKEFGKLLPITNSLVYWTWKQGRLIIFNPPGATVDMEIEIKYISLAVPYIANENTILYIIGGRTYLAYKTAALCAFFIGENETRAKVLEDRAELAVERSINISNKGKQEIVTRHRPFRAAFKARGGF